MQLNRIRQLDETFEHFLDTVAVEASETELIPELRAERRKRCDNNDFEFCKEYFPHIFTDPFNKVHDHISSLNSGIYSISGARFFGKTAFTICSRIIKPLSIGGNGMLGLALRDVEDSVERTAAIARLMQRNKKLMYDYSINFQQDKKGYYIVNNMHLVALGMRQGLRNMLDDDFKRFKFILADDLFNRISVGSELDNEKVFNFITSECAGQLEPGGLMIWLFNYISANSPGKKYADDHKETHFNLPALDENEKSNWENSRWTTEALLKKREELTFDVWQGDWMNDPIQKGEIFEVDWLKPVPISLQKFVAVLAAIDPSHGKSPAACDKGICILGIDNKGECVMIDVYIRKEDYSFVFDYLDVQRSMWHQFRAILFENDFNQWFSAAQYYQDWCEKRKKFLPIIPYSAKSLKTDVYGSDKDSRIMNLVHPFQTGKIKVNQDIINTPDYKKWRNQYIEFGKHKTKLDGLDATATAFIMLPRYQKTGTFKSLAKRTNQKDAWLENR